MPEQQRNYYVLCDDNCRFPGMTSEQIIAAIAEATGETPVHIDDAFITKIKEQNKNKSLKIWVGTEAEYNAIITKDNNTMYVFKTTTGKILLHDALELKNLIGNLDDLETTEKSNLVGAINENAEAIEDLSVDYIVEQGTSGGWHYTKWNNGDAKLVGTFTYPAGSWVAWGSLFERNDGGTIPFPFAFLDTPSISFGATSHAIVGFEYSLNNTQLLNWYAVRPNNAGDGGAYKVGMTVEGRWK